MWQLNDCLFVKRVESKRRQAGRGSRSGYPRPGGNASSKRKADAIRRLGIAGRPPFIGK
jgi:hypothetical protein